MKESHQFSYWEKTEWLTPPDLLIVGGGITGSSVALFYKQQFPDHDVLLVDRGFAPNGASTRNAGFACIGSISEHLADIKVAGEETVLNRIGRRWNGLQLLRKTMGDDAMGYQHTGGFEIFPESDRFIRCRDQISEMNRKMENRTGLKEVYSETECNGYPAIRNRVEGAINSGKLIRSLHKRIADLGVRIWWNSPVKRADRDGVLFDNGLVLKPEKTVLAVNGFQSAFSESKVQPARGYILVTKPIREMPWRGTFHYNEGYVYFRDVGENRLLLGGGRNVDKEGETTHRFGTNEKIRDYLIDFATNTLNLPHGWEIDMEWSGIMGMTPDKEPEILESEPGIWSAAGLSGMGIAIGMEVARELVQRIKR
jgi:glycine/D-amino acid oxidase-like deaminating enzyme